MGLTFIDGECRIRSGFFPLSSSGNSQHFFVCVCVSAKSLSSVDIILVHVYTCSLCIEKIKYDDRLSSKKNFGLRVELEAVALTGR